MIEVTRSFNEMTSSLEQAERLRRNLMADVAHELRTPLTVLQGNLRAILDGVYSMDAGEIARLYDETRLLGRLVDDLRELAQAEAGQLGLNLRSTDVQRFIDETVDRFLPVAESKGVSLVVEAAGAMPAISIDPDRIAQVLGNLLTNALRHTHEGGKITVAADVGGERLDRIVVSVRDSGEGISPEDLEHVFDRFWRADRSRNRESGGSGLGLAIARSLVQAHGGGIEAQSALGQGATFTFWLPAAQESA
jgi:signal transduction histidine kinase